MADDANWVEDSNNNRVEDDSGNWVYVGELGTDRGDKFPPTINIINHHHGLVTKRISNRYDVSVDHDACVASVAPDTNFGSNPVLGVFETSDPHYVYVYMKATELSNFPSKHTLDHAFLNIKRIYSIGHEQITRLAINLVVDDDWDESTITWNNQPGINPAQDNIPNYELRNITSDEWISIDITYWMQKIIDEETDNWGLILAAEEIDPIKRFHSSEAANAEDRPFFSLYYFPYD